MTAVGGELFQRKKKKQQNTKTKKAAPRILL